MAIPGLKEKYEVRAKVRIGEKRQTSRGTSFPAAVDHFVCPDPELAQLFGDKPSTIRVRFPYADLEDNFSSGLEWWVKKSGKDRPTLACYTKGEGDPPVALRLEHFYDADRDERRGENVGAGRVPITCPFRECAFFKKADCKPMARLLFFLDGGRTDACLQIDTKSWNTIERLTGALAGARHSGPLTGRVFELSVAFETKGANRFPVLSLSEVDLVINNDRDVEKVEAVMAAERVKAAGGSVKAQLAAALDVEVPNWREREDVIARIREVGAEAALAKMMERLDS